MKLRDCILAGMLCCMMGCISEKPEPVAVARLDKAMEEYKAMAPAQRDSLRQAMGPEIGALFTALGYPEPDDAVLDWWSHSDEVRVFQPDVDAAFPDLDDLEQELGYVMDSARRNALPVDSLRFAAVAWGKPQPIMVVDSIVLIALNHYLGPNYPGYSHLQSYRRAEKTPETLPYDVAGVLAARAYPFATKQAPTVLNWLLYEGALVEARMRLVDGATLAACLGYRPDQVEYLQDNMADIKREMASRRMLYDTNPDTIDKLFSSAPSAPLLNGQAPGRAGRYIGYEIVCEYLRKHPHAALADLLSPSFYDNPQTIIEAGY